MGFRFGNIVRELLSRLRSPKEANALLPSAPGGLPQRTNPIDGGTEVATEWVAGVDLWGKGDSGVYVQRPGGPHIPEADLQ